MDSAEPPTLGSLPESFNEVTNELAVEGCSGYSYADYEEFEGLIAFARDYADSNYELLNYVKNQNLTSPFFTCVLMAINRTLPSEYLPPLYFSGFNTQYVNMNCSALGDAVSQDQFDSLEQAALNFSSFQQIVAYIEKNATIDQSEPFWQCVEQALNDSVYTEPYVLNSSQFGPLNQELLLKDCNQFMTQLDFLQEQDLAQMQDNLTEYETLASYITQMNYTSPYWQCF